MVKAILIALAMTAGAAPAEAAPDWRRAGGGLFVGAEAADAAPADMDAVLEPVRLAPLNQPFAEDVSAAAERHGLDPKLLHALVTVESAYRVKAVSPVGAAGLTQLMPATARELGIVDRFDPAANLLGGADYLARQLLRFGDVRLALAAYNAGPGRVAQLGRVPEIAETKAYVQAVVECYLALSAGRGVRSSRECRAPGALP
jgi:soluble lytic murein transglycosylase-like protein